MFCLILLPALLLVLQSSPLQSQEGVVPTCPECRIELEEIARLGGGGDDTWSGGFAVVKKGKEHFYVVNWDEPRSVWVFDLSGSLVKKIGGPGQFGHIIAVEPMPGDSLLLLDYQQRKVTVLDPRYEVVREWPIPLIPEEKSIAILPGQCVLLSGQIQTRDLIGIPYHIFTPEGHKVFSFGVGEPPNTRLVIGQLLQFPRLAGDGTLWVAHHRQYRLAHWTIEGEMVGALEPRRSWMTADARGSHGLFPAIMDLSAAEADRLWVLGRAVDPDWEVASRADSLPQGYGAGYLSVFDVYDVATGSLFTSTTVDVFLLGFADHGYVYGFRSGEPLTHISVWRVRLVDHQKP